jgi:type IV pilus assembly protein PilF
MRFFNPGLARWLGVGVWMLLAACASDLSAPSASAPSATRLDEPEARKRARLRLELAAAYFQQAQTAVALDEVEKSLLADSNYGPAYDLRGLILMRLNDLPAAQDNFLQALRLMPNAPGVLHNLAWLQCQQSRFAESFALFQQVLATPQYTEQAKTHLTLALCQIKASLVHEAEQSLTKSYALAPDNPVTTYQLALLLFNQGEAERARFYARRLNNSPAANAESLALGMQIERALGHPELALQLAQQLQKRFPQSQSREAAANSEGVLHE